MNQPPTSSQQQQQQNGSTFSRMYIKAIFSIMLAFCATHVLALDFSTSKWIWTNEVDSSGRAPAGSRAFRRDFSSPAGKTALSASIAIAADNHYTLYVNGASIGTGDNYRVAGAYCIRLAPEHNVFAVKATNDLAVRNPAALIATIQIRYTDGSTVIIVSDENWHAFNSLPAGFQNQGFNDSSWPAATVEVNYGAAPWGTVTIPPSASIEPLSLAGANWIWTNEVNNGVAPVGARALRQTIILPAGQAATSANIVVGVDNAFTLYLQGKTVGSGTVWANGHRYAVDIQPAASQIDVAIYARNEGGPAGAVVAIQFMMEDCYCQSVVSYMTDRTWKYNTAIPTGFEVSGYNDSAWPAAIEEGLYGTAPWHNLTLPAAVSPGSAAIAGAAIAEPASVIS